MFSINMLLKKMNVVSRTMALVLLSGFFLVGCGSDGADTSTELVETQSTDSETTDDSTGTETADNTAEPVIADFDGTWRAGCFAVRSFMEPEEDQPNGYSQTTLSIDSKASTYSTTMRLYTDSQCMAENPDLAAIQRSGEILFDGVTTTSSGLEATVARYFSAGSSPDLIGLLYREDDVLYRELRQSTLIEDIAPTDLNLSNPWQLVD